MRGSDPAEAAAQSRASAFRAGTRFPEPVVRQKGIAEHVQERELGSEVVSEGCCPVHHWRPMGASSTAARMRRGRSSAPPPMTRAGTVSCRIKRSSVRPLLPSRALRPRTTTSASRLRAASARLWTADPTRTCTERSWAPSVAAKPRRPGSGLPTAISSRSSSAGIIGFKNPGTSGTESTCASSIRVQLPKWMAAHLAAASEGWRKSTPTSMRSSTGREIPLSGGLGTWLTCVMSFPPPLSYTARTSSSPV